MTNSSIPDKHTLRLHLQTLATEIGKPPTVVDMHNQGKYHPEIYLDAYGTWEEALHNAGLDPDDINKKISDLDLLAELERLDEKFGRPPKKTELAEQSKYSAKTYQERFGSWNNALEEAMLDTRTLSEQDLLQEIRQLDEELDHTPRQRDMSEHGEYGAVTYYRRFDSWTDALEQAGVEPDERQQTVSETTVDRESDDILNSESLAMETVPASDAAVTAEALARTYQSQSYEDPWSAVEQYQRVMEYAASNQDAGSSAVASVLDLPRSRIRPWLEDDARPDCVRAVHTAEANDWLPLTINSAVFPAFNTLVAWILSSGSIDAEQFVPSFVVDDAAARSRIADALRELGLGVRVVRDQEHARATEVIPDSAASVLGRMLTVLGVPQGEKNNNAEVRLPVYLGVAPPSIREEFVDVYLWNRGQTHAEKATITVHEDRSQEYLEQLAVLFRQVSGGSVSVAGQNVILSADAARNLYGRFGPSWA